MHIFSFRLTRATLAARGDSRRVSFWNMLYDGYAWFERYRVSPNIEVRGNIYVISDVTGANVPGTDSDGAEFL